MTRRAAAKRLSAFFPSLRLRPTRGYTRQAAIGPNKPTPSAVQFPFSVLANGNFLTKLATEPLSPILCMPKTSVLPIYGNFGAIKSGLFRWSRRIRSSDALIFTRKWGRSPLLWGCLLGHIAASLLLPQYAKAESPFPAGACASEKALGPEHPDVATIHNNLAELSRAQGQYEKAEPE